MCARRIAAFSLEGQAGRAWHTARIFNYFQTRRQHNILNNRQNFCFVASGLRPLTAHGKSL